MKKIDSEEETKVSEVKPEVKYMWFEPKDKEHTDPIWVCINGKGTLIQRGVEVEVSKPVYDVLMNRRRMNSLALDRQIELQENANKF